MNSTRYIKTGLYTCVDDAQNNCAPRFRKKFCISKDVAKAEVCYAGLGIGCFYLNGKKITEDLFTAPVSEYTKTVWYNRYDVTELLCGGDNIIAAILGNGFYNETIKSGWSHNEARWRDAPKLIFNLKITFKDGTTEEIKSDDSWLCTESTPYTFNALRIGVSYDARLYEKNWNTLEYDDSAWTNAQIDDNEPSGVLRECLCEPIREFETLSAKRIAKIDDKYVIDFGRNVSGYVRIHAKYLENGQKITIRYAESLNEDGSICMNGCDGPNYYPESRYAFTDFTANGEDFVWSPDFAYFGFRYIEVSGLTKKPSDDMFESVFVHQALARKADFKCSNEKINRLYEMGINATYSNMFYAPTDCPTREKLGWANDAQSSTEQFLIDFDSVKFLTKWYQDILDAMREDGELPGIIPSSGWGYTWGNGPISTGILFEIPLRIYLYTGDDTLLRKNTAAFKKHLARMASQTNDKGLIDYGLCDWAGPWKEGNQGSPVKRECTNTLLYIKFLRVTRFALQLNGEDTAEIDVEEKRFTDLFYSLYFDESGKLNVPYQTAASMCIMLDIYKDLSVVAEQLVEAVERENYHINCGMLGIRYLYYALRKIGRDDLSYKIVTSTGYPSYMSWIDERDATTLCEMWKNKDSQNHHMYSDVCAWMIKVLAGINPVTAGFKKCLIKPYFEKELSYCEAYEDTVSGRISVLWKRNSDKIDLTVTVPEGVEAQLEVSGNVIALQSGTTEMCI